MQNGLQLNPDKSEALFTGTATQLSAVSSLKSVSAADVDLPVADSMRVLGVTLDRRPTFDNHASAVARSCKYHARVIRRIRHLLTLDLAQTLACSLILSRSDYCNSVLHDAPSSTILKLQRVQNNAARIVLRAPRRSDVNSLLQTLHWLPVEQRIRADVQDSADVISAVSEPEHLVAHQRTQHSIVVRPTAVRDISTDIICQTIVSTAAPLTWNSLPPAVLNCD